MNPPHVKRERFDAFCRACLDTLKATQTGTSLSAGSAATAALEVVAVRKVRSFVNKSRPDRARVAAKIAMAVLLTLSSRTLRAEPLSGEYLLTNPKQARYFSNGRSLPSCGSQARVLLDATRSLRASYHVDLIVNKELWKLVRTSRNTIFASLKISEVDELSLSITIRDADNAVGDLVFLRSRGNRVVCADALRFVGGLVAP